MWGAGLQWGCMLNRLKGLLRHFWDYRWEQKDSGISYDVSYLEGGYFFLASILGTCLDVVNYKIITVTLLDRVQQYHRYRATKRDLVRDREFHGRGRIQTGYALPAYFMFFSW